MPVRLIHFHCEPRCGVNEICSVPDGHRIDVILVLSNRVLPFLHKSRRVVSRLPIIVVVELCRHGLFWEHISSERIRRPEDHTMYELTEADVVF